MMRARLCLLLGFIVSAFGCSKPQPPAAPATDNPISGQLANSPPAVTLAGNNASNTNAVIGAGAGANANVGAAGTGVPATGGSTAVVGGQGGSEMDAAGRAGSNNAGAGSNA